MILTNNPANEAILGNVSEVGEFRIRNSSKAFSILSSGLYANKIRAIIRELSCNAVDSHVAAGKKDTPFDVHLPNRFEPWFSIRDYGTGLDHDQVTNIYTTYFESTKTDSNSFIGALGLGSKSPFSYTDNFTVTAIKDGSKGIYTAFINDQGVPSIAVMMREETQEPNGVEVKFSVNDHFDFDKFRHEAATVYKYFSLKPIVSGTTNFTVEQIRYETQDIVPGVHCRAQYSNTIAVMGNIAYPVDIPSAQNVLGNLYQLLQCGLEIHFDIGELDFQASREGLSYIPQTIQAIKSKLELLNTELESHIEKEANAIPNLWKRASFLNQKRNVKLWQAAVLAYAKKAKLPTFTGDTANTLRMARWKLSLSDLASKFNINMRCVDIRGYKNATVKPLYEYMQDRSQVFFWSINVSTDVHFVVNDTKIGATERTKYHYRNSKNTAQYVYVIEAADKSKPVLVNELFEALHNPPEENILKASALLQAPKDTKVGGAAAILRLESRDTYRMRSSDGDMVWRSVGDISTLDSSKTYYYVPLSGYTMESQYGYVDAKSLYDDLCSVNLFVDYIYGVRKSDIDSVKLQKNWINLETHIATLLKNSTLESLLLPTIKAMPECNFIFEQNAAQIASLVTDQDSIYKKVVSTFGKVRSKDRHELRNSDNLIKRFTKLDTEQFLKPYRQLVTDLHATYPLLYELRNRYLQSEPIAHYINLCDAYKKATSVN